MGDLSVSLVYQFIPLFVYISIGSQILFLVSTLQSRMTSIISLLKFVLIWLLDLSVGFYTYFDMPSSKYVCACMHLSTPLHPGTERYPRLTLCISYLKRSHFSKDFCFLFVREWYSRARSRCSLLASVSFLLGVLRWQSKKLYVCIITCVSTHICKYSTCSHLYLCCGK